MFRRAFFTGPVVVGSLHGDEPAREDRSGVRHLFDRLEVEGGAPDRRRADRADEGLGRRAGVVADGAGEEEAEKDTHGGGFHAAAPPTTHHPPRRPPSHLSSSRSTHCEQSVWRQRWWPSHTFMKNWRPFW